MIFFVTLSGLFSMATASRIFADYALALCPWAPAAVRDYALPILFVIALSGIAVRGIVLSSLANIICTVIEVLGLLAIIVVASRYVGSVNYMEFAASPPTPIPFMVVTGASIAFFAFVGFEDLVNLSEEVRRPERNIPLGICLAIAITAFIYCAIAVVAVSVLKPEVLAQTRSPLLDVVRQACPAFPFWLYAVIPGFAVFNTALLNLMMASRLLYGMSRDDAGVLPSALTYVHASWRTPVVGVGVCAAIVAVLLVCIRDVTTLASGTAAFLLVVFVLLHIGLLRIKRDAAAPAPAFRVPALVPLAGAAAGVGLLAGQNAAALRTAGLLTVFALAIYSVNRLSRRRRGVNAR